MQNFKSFAWGLFLSVIGATQAWATPVNLRNVNSTLPNDADFVTTLNTLSAPRSITLPQAANFNGSVIQFYDTLPAVNGINTYTFLAQGTDLVNGAASFTVSAPGSNVFFVRNPSGWYASAINNNSGAATVINVSQFGARCDSATDDDAAINAAFTALRTLTQGSANNTNGVLTFDVGRRCLVSSINATGFTKGNVLINGNGKTLYGRQAGVPVFDMLGSAGGSGSFLIVNNLSILSSSDIVPSYGIQIGRLNTTALDNGGSNITFNGVNVTGFYTTAGCYNFAGEGVMYIDVICTNANTGANSFPFVMDGFNHFNITSNFATELAPVDSGQSFNGNVVIRGSFKAQGSGNTAAMWWGGGRQHRMQAYLLNNSGSSCTTIYNEVAVNNSGLSQSNVFDNHCEGSNIADHYIISGNIAAPIMYDSTFIESIYTATNSMFKLGGSVTSVSCLSCKLTVAGVTSSSVATAKVFDAPSAWTNWTGIASLSQTSMWNSPASFSGALFLTGAVQQVFNNAIQLAGTGSPNSAISAPVGSLYSRTDGGANTTFYVKESGTGNTGWVAK